MPSDPEIPEQEKFSSRQEQEEFEPVDFDPTVRAAIAHMEKHDIDLENESSISDQLLDEYAQVLHQLKAEQNPAAEEALIARRLALRQELKTFTTELDDELAQASKRRDELEKTANVVEHEHQLDSKYYPDDDQTPEAALFFECRRIRMLATELLHHIRDKQPFIAPNERPAVIGQGQKLERQMLLATEELSSHRAEPRHPEQVSLAIWQSTHDKLQDVFEEILLLERDVMQRHGQPSDESRPPGDHDQS